MNRTPLPPPRVSPTSRKITPASSNARSIAARDWAETFGIQGGQLVVRCDGRVDVAGLGDAGALPPRKFINASTDYPTSGHIVRADLSDKARRGRLSFQVRLAALRSPRKSTRGLEQRTVRGRWRWSCSAVHNPGRSRSLLRPMAVRCLCYGFVLGRQSTFRRRPSSC